MKTKKLSRRRGTPFYRHRDAWAKHSPLLSCLRRLYDAGGKAWDKIRDHQKFIEEMR